MKLYWLTLIAFGLAFNGVTLADDTEIYVTSTDTSNGIYPNVIFLMDTSGSMGYDAYEDGVKVGSRLEVVREVATEVITSTSDINISIMRFNRKDSEGASISSPMLPIDQEGVRNLVKEVLYSYEAAGGTPITESLYEAGAYLRGDKIKYGYKETANSDLCMVWEEQLVPVKSSSTSKPTRSLANRQASAFSTSYLDTSVFYFPLLKNEPYLVNNELLDRSTMSWVPWGSLPKWVKKKLKNDFGIKKKHYGSSPVPWFAVMDAWRWDYIVDPKNGAYTEWNDLDGWFQRDLTDDYGITEPIYNSYIHGSTPTPPPKEEEPVEEEPEEEYETVYVCTEYLNLDDAIDGDYYNSPITDSCQTNHIVLFSDGSPTNDTGINTTVRNLVGTLPSGDYPSESYFSTDCSGSGGCSEELAYYFQTADNSDLDGAQPIYVHTIGGFISGSTQQRMDHIAHEGGGISGSGSDATSLRLALNSVFETISATAGTFSAPAVTVNAYNSLEHLDQLYFSLFQPETTSAWGGNVKRYRLTSEGNIVDAEGDTAVDPDSGYFDDDARSYWTLSEDAPDGKAVKKGGAARRITSVNNRKVVTYFGKSKNLMDSSNAVNTSNSKITADLLDSAATGDDLKKQKLWLQGYDGTSTTNLVARRAMEDPLHSQPVVVHYGKSTSASGEKELDSTLYIATNSGYLHAFNTNADNPKEHFAFIPKELMKVALEYHAQSADKVYGLDGPITVDHYDTDKDGIVDANEKAYLYVGMRRGGRSYYALDISDRNNPKYLWQIDGGSGDFNELGQTWSEMKPITIEWKGSKRRALVFGGGYDTAEDTNTSRQDHSMGNAIFIVDAVTGDLLWKASNDTGDLKLKDMTSGIVGDVFPADDDGNGTIDILYTADLGGRIWRIDILPESNGAYDFAQGGVIADLGQDNTTSEHVRFYNSVDVIYAETGVFYDSANDDYYSQGRYQISIGSGYRAHPLNKKTTDHFYMVNDFDVEGPPNSYSRLRKSNLADYSKYSSESASKQKNGVFFQLPDDGEKVLADAITINYTTFFTTYRPSTGTSRSGCEPDIGDGRAYAIKLDYNFGATPNLDSVEVSTPGIPPTPQLVFPPDSVDPVVLIGPVVVTGSDDGGADGGEMDDDDDDLGNPLDEIMTRSFWREL
jgi:type IV pilus assembly protein PilY1